LGDYGVSGRKDRLRKRRFSRYQDCLPWWVWASDMKIKIAAAKMTVVDLGLFRSTIRTMLKHALEENCWKKSESTKKKREYWAMLMRILFPIDWPEPFRVLTMISKTFGYGGKARRFSLSPCGSGSGNLSKILLVDRVLLVDLNRSAIERR